ncbi:chymotrypsin-1-like [Anticarsia gemmatalis]|uniref:chymotrypsin-1-like n=1 Tax=Anticarsia gemmatalis TaxID=129554 RepID=UPI003F76736E
METRVVVVISLLSYMVDLCDGEFEPYIVYGEYAKIGKFPYTAFLNVQCIDEPGEIPTPWICGSAIVNDRILITAAHCLYGCLQTSTIIISVGHVQIMKGAVTRARSYIIHEKYDDDRINNDIALVRVRKRLKLNSNVSRLAITRRPPYKEKAFVAGWGLDGVSTTEKLKYTEQYVWQGKRCLKLLKSMPKGTICAHSKMGYADRGDSGSALVVRGYLQIGIVSFKKPRLSKSVIIYTDTGYYYNWIVKTTNKILCK